MNFDTEERQDLGGQKCSPLSIKDVAVKFLYTRREFLREILYKNIAIIAIQHGKFILLTPLAIFSILLGEIHSSPSGKFAYTY